MRENLLLMLKSMLYIQNSSSEKTIKLVLEMILADNGLLFFCSAKLQNVKKCYQLSVYSNIFKCLHDV